MSDFTKINGNLSKQGQQTSGSVLPQVSDGITIVGSGDPQFPFASDANGFIVQELINQIFPGTPGYADPGGTGAPLVAIATSLEKATIIGLFGPLPGRAIASDPPTEFRTFITSGSLELPLADWDVVTGEVGGLVPNARYYLSAGTAPVSLTRTKPSAGGTYVVKIGTALSGTVMIVQVGDPVANLG